MGILALLLFAIPALAQKNHRSNRGGAVRGIARSDQVENKNGDRDRDPSPFKGSKSNRSPGTI